MDDNQRITIQHRGGTLKVKPFTREQIVAMSLMGGAKPGTVMRIIRELLSASLGPDNFAALLSGLISGEVKADELNRLVAVIAKKSDPIVADPDATPESV